MQPKSLSLPTGSQDESESEELVFVLSDTDSWIKCSRVHLIMQAVLSGVVPWKR